LVGVISKSSRADSKRETEKETRVLCEMDIIISRSSLPLSQTSELYFDKALSCDRIECREIVAVRVAIWPILPAVYASENSCMMHDRAKEEGEGTERERF